MFFVNKRSENKNINIPMEIKKETEEVLLDYSIVKEEYNVDDEESALKMKIEMPDQSQKIVQFVIEEVAEKKQKSKERNAGDFHCRQCRNVYKTEKGLKEHLGNCSAERFSCNICGKTFKVKRYLTRHLNLHSSERKYECECGLKFKQQFTLKRHILTVHMGKKQKKISYICDKCGKVFSCKSNRDRHLLTHSNTNIKCPLCSKEFSHIGVLKLHMMVHSSDRSFPCSVCGEKFSLIVDFQNHLMIHQRDPEMPKKLEKKHKCLQCEKSFGDSFKLRCHVATNHSNEKNFSCSQCGNKFATRGALTSHEARHSGRVECKICNTVFANTFTYKRHLKVHTQEKRFECEICGKRFLERSSMKRHILLIHSDKNENTGEAVIDCSRCEEKIVGKYKYRLHMAAVHSRMANVECSKCRKRFAVQKLFPLTKQEMTNKFHICHNCNREQKTEEEHKELRRLHAEHPKICFHCDETFYNAECFKSHVEQAHKEGGDADAGKESQVDVNILKEVKVEIKTEEDSS